MGLAQRIIRRSMVKVNSPAAPLLGSIVPPSDKSITHRLLFFGALNRGMTVIRRPSGGEDCRSTMLLLRTVGYQPEEREGEWLFEGRGMVPEQGSRSIDCGNSGTTARLAIGFLTGERGSFNLTGDASLKRRPMEKVVSLIRHLGGNITTSNGLLPVSVIATEGLHGTNDGEVLDVGSAQLHAAVTLAAIRSERGAVIRRVKPMRDHTIRVARAFGLAVDTSSDSIHTVDTVLPTQIDRDLEFDVPGDLSSAVFLVVAALLVPGSSVRIDNVGLNPTRTPFLHALKEMGGDLVWKIEEDRGEPIGSIEARYSPDLKGIVVSDDRDLASFSAADMIDELPLLALIASRAAGETRVTGAGELRAKESDRITALIAVLKGLGIECEELEDGFRIVGPQSVRGGGEIFAHHDHRLCMVAAVAGLVADESITISDSDSVAISYPSFFSDLQSLTTDTIVESLAL